MLQCKSAVVVEKEKEETMISSEPEPIGVESGKTSDTMKRRFRVIYLGSSSMDRRYTQCIQPWVMAEIRRKKEGFRDVTLDVLSHSHSLRATAWDTDGQAEVLFEHRLQELTRFAKLHQDPRCFAYLSRQQLNNDDFECHVFLTNHEEMVCMNILFLFKLISAILPNVPASGLGVWF